MDATESHARKYLEHLRVRDIVYDPDGNVPPDFLVDGRIAVEVRRLDQHERNTGTARGREETETPLLRGMQDAVASFGPPGTDGASWAVWYRYRRPVPPWNTLGPLVMEWLTAFRDGQRPRRADASFGNDFSLTLARASASHKQVFWIGGHTDLDAGGMMLRLMRENIQICIEEKARKVTSARGNYPEWWLILVDRVGFGLDSFDREQFRASVSLIHDWDKVIILAAHDHTSAFEV